MRLLNSYLLLGAVGFTLLGHGASLDNKKMCLMPRSSADSFHAVESWRNDFFDREAPQYLEALKDRAVSGGNRFAIISQYAIDSHEKMLKLRERIDKLESQKKSLSTFLKNQAQWTDLQSKVSREVLAASFRNQSVVEKIKIIMSKKGMREEFKKKLDQWLAEKGPQILENAQKKHDEMSEGKEPL